MGIAVSTSLEDKVAKKSEFVVKCYVSSKSLNVKKLLRATRSHWLVKLMCLSLGTTFGEDSNCKLAEESAENCGRIRQAC